MNRHLAFVLASTCFAAVPAFADDITIDPHPFVSTLSRAQVKEELRQFRQSGVDPWAQNYDQLAGFHSTATRAEVRAAYIAERDAVSALNSEDSGSAYMNRMAAAKAHPGMTRLANAKTE